MRPEDLDKLADAILERLGELEKVDELSSAILRRLQQATPPGLRRRMAESLSGLVTSTLTCPTGSPPYMCTTQQYYVPCSYPNQYDPWDPCSGYTCREYHFFSECGSGYHCSGDAEFACKGDAYADFDCGFTSDGAFTCAAQTFRCDTGELIDFRCHDKGTFVPFNCQNTFSCEANHIFQCGLGLVPTNAFQCDGAKFSCKAGDPVTAQCGSPQNAYIYAISGGDPGGSWDYTPGDFKCDVFLCEHAGAKPFKCQAADDFDCGSWGGLRFMCRGVPPQDPFLCEGASPTTFECLTMPGGYSAT